MCSDHAIAASTPTLAGAGWRLALTPAGLWSHPSEMVEGFDWIAAEVPGTVAGALAAAGRWSLDAPPPIERQDAWYRAQFEAFGAHTLVFHGLAGPAKVWLNGELVLTCDSMFVRHEIVVRCEGRNEIVIAFAAEPTRPAPNLGRRPRWRPQLAPASLRNTRQTLLGRMPGWCPHVPAIGPWRPIEALDASVPRLRVKEVATRCDGTRGILEMAVDCEGYDLAGASLSVDGVSAPFEADGPGVARARVVIDEVERWWPHTHGEPRLYEAAARFRRRATPACRADAVYDVVHTEAGFRTVEVDRGPDRCGFALMVNDTRVFCRGACWTTADIVRLPGRAADYEPWLVEARAAGVNMLRVTGVGVYEATAFYARCAELGIMVWQDFMLANFDYPADDAGFRAAIETEASQFLRRTQGCPALAVLCGGSEVYQQAAMSGVPAGAWRSPLFEEELPAIVAAMRPDVPYVVNSPSGGDLPFAVAEGISHYYGVGAYLRPLEQLRLDDVRFASECLAFAQVPDAVALEKLLPVPALHHPRWKQRVPRDAGASWDFDDVREHYLASMFDVDPRRLRIEDPGRYLDLSRAVTVEIVERAFAEWRRPGSRAGGGLLWTLQDVWPGAGWGVLNADGSPKPVWSAMRRAFRPVNITMTDEGLGGLAVHVVNDSGVVRSLKVCLTLFASSGAKVAEASRDVVVGPAGGETVSATALLGRFFDTSYAYRFGPLGFETAHARLLDGAPVAEAFHFPSGRPLAIGDRGLEARLFAASDGWRLAVSAKRVASFVHLVDDAFVADDEWFHLPPGGEKVLRLARRPGVHADRVAPRGDLRALNHAGAVAYSSTSQP